MAKRFYIKNRYENDQINAKKKRYLFCDSQTDVPLNKMRNIYVEIPKLILFFLQQIFRLLLRLYKF